MKTSIACYGGAINYGHIELEETDKDSVWLKMIGYMGGEESLILGLEELKALQADLLDRINQIEDTE